MLAAASASPLASAGQEQAVVLRALDRMAAAFSRVRTFQSRLHMENGEMLVDYIAPDAFRFRSLQQTAVMIGAKVYSKASRGWVSADLPVAGFIRGLVLEPKIMPQWARAGTAVYVSAFARGKTTVRTFRYMSFSHGVELVTTVAIGDDDHLPRFATYDTADTHTLVDYLAFDVPLDFGISLKS
jgi:hypothetical protein